MQSPGRRRAIVLGVLGLMLALSSCKTDWPTWGDGVGRQGFNPSEHTIGVANVSQLHQQWSVDLGAYINSSPIEAINIRIGGRPTDVVYVGTEHGAFFALDTSGKILWFRDLGSNTTDCPDTPDKVYGVSASAVFDRATNRVYVVGGNGYMYALNPATGATVPGWPVQLTTSPTHEFVYDAPNLFNGNLYVGLASRCDNPPYHGRLVRINTQTRASNAFYVTGGPTGPDGGGIWGWGGASIDPNDGDVYIGTANVFADPENSFYGDAIVRLNPDLSVVSTNSPGVGRQDDGFGSTPTLFQTSGCPPQLAAQMKNGGLFLYDRDSISTGYRQKIQSADFSINVPAYSPATELLYVLNGGGMAPFVTGIQAFRHNAACNLELAWQFASPVSIGSAPTIANGVVYYADGFGQTIHALSASTGAPLWASGPEIGGGVLAAPIVINGQLFAGSYDNHLHAYGLP
jgi:Glucose dehydrogenase